MIIPRGRKLGAKNEEKQLEQKKSKSKLLDLNTNILVSTQNISEQSMSVKNQDCKMGKK